MNLPWPFKKKRTDIDKLICTLDSMVFVLLNSRNQTIHKTVGKLYISIPRETKNGRLGKIEMKMLLLQEHVQREPRG
jgi:hypothetical protein